jgi:hypothetical protein
MRENAGAPLEIERKFLIRMPNAEALAAQKGARVWRISQTYLLSPAGLSRRVRKRQEGDEVRYIYTEKLRISPTTAEARERELTEEEYMELFPSLFADYGVPILLYLIYLLIMGALNITGLVLFIINVKKVRVNKYDSTLTLVERRRAIFLNVGMIVAIVGLVIMMIISLFPQ